jgi:hypothetical protein
LFRGRHYRQVGVADDRVVVTTRKGDVVLDVGTDELEVSGVRTNGLLLQVLATDSSSRTHVFEFRLRHRSVGRAFADALR